MKFKLLENINRGYERFFYIVRNDSGNYLAMHKDENNAHTRYLKSGQYHVDPFCWSKRKSDVVDALNDIVENVPVEAKEMFMPKHQALRLGVHTYDGQELPHKEMNENAIGNNNEINKKKYRKHSQSPFTKLGTDPEKNMAAFNKANNVGKIPTSGRGMSGNGDAGASSGGDAGGAGAGA